MPLLKKPAGAPANKQQANQKEESRPAPGAGKTVKKDAFAERYAKAEGKERGGWTPPDPGTYNCLVTEGQGVIDGEKTVAYLECIICDEGDFQGKTIRLYWNFTDVEGKEMAGIEYFKSNMAMCGADEDFTSWDDMCDTLAEIARTEMWVVIDVKKKGKYINCYLSSVPDNQAEKPDMPS